MTGQKYVSSILDMPYHALVVYGYLYCSGSIIRSKIVLTTASCIVAGPQEKMFVKVGSNSITDLGQVIPVIHTKIHEYFRYYGALDNDIALLFLKENVIFGDKVKKVLLVPQETYVEPGVVLEVSGWGSQNLPQKYAYLLLSSDMVVMDRDECRKIHKKKITPSNFCAKYESNHGLSDIGGPATHKDLLVGIVSYGACSEKGPYVAILTNISYFNKWIMLNTKRFLEDNCIPDQRKNITDTPTIDMLDEVQIGLVHRGIPGTLSN
ncbi:unnamed protein product [Arctia plantaginis]|uniref:Peptidase S1 domain-containing protein n=1 Tax=Arctia plantaginis TaxID=874455 RepID=A0A8S0ZDD7_ARCPL|nr:unnamed protein product [Arctia plantaginis]